MQSFRDNALVSLCEAQETIEQLEAKLAKAEAALELVLCANEPSDHAYEMLENVEIDIELYEARH
jgi:hypothetical protein